MCDFPLSSVWGQPLDVDGLRGSGGQLEFEIRDERLNGFGGLLESKLLRVQIFHHALQGPGEIRIGRAEAHGRGRVVERVGRRVRRVRFKRGLLLHGHDLGHRVTLVRAQRVAADRGRLGGLRIKLREQAHHCGDLLLDRRVGVLPQLTQKRSDLRSVHARPQQRGQVGHGVPPGVGVRLSRPQNALWRQARTGARLGLAGRHVGWSLFVGGALALGVF